MLYQCIMIIYTTTTRYDPPRLTMNVSKLANQPVTENIHYPTAPTGWQLESRHRIRIDDNLDHYLGLMKRFSKNPRPRHSTTV